MYNVSYRQFIWERKYADPLNDVAFFKLFGDEKNKDILIHFINSVLKRKHVKDVEYLPGNSDLYVRYMRQSIIDVLCTDEDGSKYIVQIRNSNRKEEFEEKKAICYASKTYGDEMEKGGKYSDLKEVILIAICNYVVFPNEKDYISHHKFEYIIEDHKLRDFSIVYIELPKYQNNHGIQLDEKSNFSTCRDNPESTDRKNDSNENENLEKNKMKENDLSAYVVIRVALDENPEIINELLGKKQGIKKERIRVTFDSGKHKTDECLTERKFHFAKKLLEMQKSLTEIKLITGLSDEQIESIKNGEIQKI